MPGKIISKSRYLNRLQCPKLLWVAVNEPARIPEPDASTQRIFDQGNLVGELAKKLFPGGIDIPTDDFMGNIARTKKLLKERVPLFEPGILCGQIYSRADILNPVDGDAWDILEVKSTTSVKEVNYHDVAFQKLCWESSGIPVRKCFIVYINNTYVKNGEIDPEQLFIIQDVSEEVAEAGIGLEDRISRMVDIIKQPVCPAPSLGHNCDSPYTCPLVEECYTGLPEHHVFTLYCGGRKAEELFQRGIVEITGIPASYEFNEKQRIQYKCVLSGMPYLDITAIRDFLSRLRYPLYFLDFETFDTAIPLFDGTRPYQKIPFQFSLHIQERPGGELQHHSFLAAGRDDPRPALIASLNRLIGGTGSVIAYNTSFETTVLNELGNAFPEYSDRMQDIISRLTDLHIPFRNFHYYHPSQKGSTSLKSVLPALTGLSYEEMPIGEGGEASTAFLNITFGDVPPDEAEKVRQQLLDYCKLDTEGMVRMLERLYDLAA